MKTRLIVTAVLCLASTCFAGLLAQQPATIPTGSLVEESVAAPSLKGNLLDDPVEQRVAVYLPPGYAAERERRYPTLYLLHGFFGPIEVFTRNGFQGMSLQPVMDQLIRNAVSREMIVVVPNGRNSYFGSFYSNSAAAGGWEDYIVRDLVAFIDSKYRTIAQSASRGIAGHSMGGFGAVMLAMKHPDVFSALYALSPCCLAFEADFERDNPAWPSTLRLQSREQLQPRPRSLQDFYNAAFIALAAAFSPDPQRGPLFVKFPFREQDGRLVVNEDVHALWKSKMPVHMIGEYTANLQKLRGIYLDFGSQEEFPHIRSATREFSNALAQRNIAHNFEVYSPGTHDSRIRHRIETRVLRFFSEVLSFQ